jgi:hypothetical protein
MSKGKNVQTPQATSFPSAPSNQLISTQTAVYILNNKIQKIEEVMKLHMDDIENKFGEHEAYVTDNIPDLDLINKALSDINTRLIDLEGLEGRIFALENSLRPNSPVSQPNQLPPPVPTQPSKKKGTVKLTDITPTPVVGAEPGISFS